MTNIGPAGQDTQDNTVKASWWFITAYNEDIEFLEAVVDGTREWPENWRKLFGGNETAPTTGRLHGQFTLNTATMRRSQVVKLLTQSWVRVCKDKDASVKYCLKELTSAGPKREAVNNKFMTVEGLLMLLGHEMNKWLKDEFEIPSEEYVNDNGYVFLARRIVYRMPHLANLASQPQLQRAWKMFHLEFQKLAREKEESDSQINSIVLPVD